MDNLLEDIDDVELKDEFKSSNLFFVDSELGKGRHCNFKFIMSYFNNSFLNEKVDHVFNQPNCAAKNNLAFRFVLENIEDRTCRYFYALENNLVMESSKPVCTQHDIVNLKKNCRKWILLIFSLGKKLRLNGNFCKLITVTVFASILKDRPMGCKDTVIPERL